VLAPAAVQQAAASGTQVRRLTADEAVRLARKNNLGIQIARFDPQLESLNGVQARAAWTPTISSSSAAEQQHVAAQQLPFGRPGLRSTPISSR
jgi:hypothetical protein